MTPPETLPQAKAKLRRKLLEQRKNHPQRSRDDAALAAHLPDLIAAARQFRSPIKVSEITPEATAPAIAAYVPHGTEPGGSALIPALLHTKTRLYLPVIGEQHTLHWSHHHSESTFRSGPYGIPEPTAPSRPDFRLDSCALILVPAVACSPEGYRLGRGGGFYDRALSAVYSQPEAQSRPLVCAVVYDNEITAEVPTEPHDMKVDAILTPSGVHWIQASPG